MSIFRIIFKLLPLIFHMAKNEAIARIFYEIADILELQKVQWKPQAYRKAARSLESLGLDVEEIYIKKGIKGLMEIPGIGDALAKKIIEFIEKGKIKEYESLRKTLPKSFYSLLEIPGLGIKRAKFLYDSLKIKSIKELEEASKKHKISKLQGFGEKSEQDILKGIEFIKSSGKEERKLLGYVLPIAREIENKLKSLKEVEKIDVAGSIRRMKETVHDIDILVQTSASKKVIDFFTSMNNVSRILAKGSKKAAIITQEGIQADVRVIDKESYGAALLYFTGSKEHNIDLRKIAIKSSMKINEYGLFKLSKNKEEKIAGETEESIYKKLGMSYIEPELREDTGEIEASIKNKLPNLIKQKEIQGDFHVHSKWSDGSDSIERMSKESEKLGHKYIAISDHAGKLAIARSINEKEIFQRNKEIDKLNEKLKIKILKSAEVDILADGSLSMPDKILKQATSLCSLKALSLLFFHHGMPLLPYLVFVLQFLSF